MKPTKKQSHILMGIVVVYLCLTGNRGLWNLYKLHQEKQSLTEQIIQLKTEMNRCQAECQSFSNSSSNIEKQAREELNLIKSNEMVYRFFKK
ncbi:MAG TPA: septum formation initiator family protein [bacterium]|nr:septum formation initiator family protein [bacterium]